VSEQVPFVTRVHRLLGIESPAAPVRSGPSVASDADDAALAEIRRRIIEPVYRGILRDGELERLSVHWAENFDEGWLYVVGGAGGEPFQHMTWVDRTPGATSVFSAREAEDAAARLAGQLEDWVCETGFGWGEQRTARYVLPEAQSDG
jgi:hypothetical protein